MIDAQLERPLPRLTDGQLLVCSAILNENSLADARHWSALSKAEALRAHRFRDAKFGARFVLCHSMLRQLLGHFVGVSPASLTIHVGAHGKPALSDEGVHFNMAHNDSRVIFAFSLTGPVGIDVENLGRRVDVPRVCDYLCTEMEQVQIDDGESLVKLWTCKEAVLKGGGVGLTVDPKRVEIDLCGTPSVARVDIGGSAVWQLTCHEFEDGDFAAVAHVGAYAEMTICNLGNVTER